MSERGACVRLCVFGEKGRRGGLGKWGWGDEIGVQSRHPDRLESPRGRGWEEKGCCSRRRTASRLARGSAGSARAGAWRVTEPTLLGKRDRVAAGVRGKFGNRRH